jgi:hypothetical protein
MFPCREGRLSEGKPSHGHNRLAKLALEQYLHHSQILTPEWGHQETVIPRCMAGQQQNRIALHFSNLRELWQGTDQVWFLKAPGLYLQPARSYVVLG